MVNVVESKRVRKLRAEIVKAITRVPNNKESQLALQGKNLTDLLIVYINWKLRSVRQCKRKAVIEKYAENDRRWTSLNGKIKSFLAKVENGDDLTPFLSLKAINHGYSLAADNPSSNKNAWDDKDFLLNVMGYHHFHLVDRSQPATRKDHDDVLFARVTRDTFTVLAILDHSVFVSPDGPSQPLTKDREFLWSIFDERSMRNTMPPSMIATSGHSLNTVCAAQKYVKVINEIDPKLDDTEFARG
ncbi:hypothetical protein L0Y46_05175, partial [bacterium]|nr:hypothetical protein [bacterium]